jgi:alanine racemase
MDQTVVDLGPGGRGVAEGDRAVLFGTGSRGEPTALDWARAASTIDYEILTGIRGRRVRRYVCADRAGPSGRPALSTRQIRQGGQP